MNPSDPRTWTVPEKWTYSLDAKWEIEELKALASHLLNRSPDYRVRLDPFEDGYVKVDVFAKTTKIGEIFVNRHPDIADSPLFRLFLGSDSHEEEVREIDDAVAVLLRPWSPWTKGD